MRRQAGFSLIELLIVIAIISILASIAVPNYQDALVRSKCAKFKGDCKAIELAIELYHNDMNQYPPEERYPVGSDIANNNNDPLYPATGFVSRSITTPIAYIGKVPKDPFPNNNPAYRPATTFPAKRPCNYSSDMQNANLYRGTINQYYVSWTYQLILVADHSIVPQVNSRPNAAVWMINSPGSDGDRDHGSDQQWTNQNNKVIVGSDYSDLPVVYDPSNGTLSNGDLFMFGPGIGFSE